MDSNPGNRKAGKPVTAKKGLNALLQDGSAKGDPNVKFCNRIGCNGRMKHDQNMKLGTTEKSNCSKTSSNGNKVDGNCLPSNDMRSVSKRINSDSKRKLSARLEIDQPESSRTGDSYAREPFSIPDGYAILKTDYGKTNVSENGKSTATSNSKPRKLFQIKSGMNEQHTHLAASVPSVSRSSSAGSSSSSLSRSIGKNVMEKGIPDRKSSSSRSGRNITAKTSVGGDSIRSIIVAGEVRNGCQQNTRSSSFGRGPSMGRPDTEMPRRSNSSQTSSANSFNRAGNAGDDSSTSVEHNLTDLQRRVALQRFNIAEVMLSLERMEQVVEGLTYEQFYALNTSFPSHGLRLNDQHRDMRLDIDNMSYEEILALEDRMGSVSTSVPEEAIEKCLNKSIYQAPPSPREKGFDKDADDIKCSICQEEYATGDEVGSLVECRHFYHVHCVSKWLRLKNWCPICKAAADPSL